MKKIMVHPLFFRNSRWWLKFSLIVVFVGWGYWLSGTWPNQPIEEYIPPRFEQLEIAQGTLSFTRRSKSSGGEIEIHLGNGKKLVLACNPPNTLPDACFRKNTGGEWLDYREKLTGKIATAWWQPEPDVPDGGRMYQMKVEDWMFFNYQEQLDYYVNHYQKGGGRNSLVGLALLLLTAFVISVLIKRKRKEPT